MDLPPAQPPRSGTKEAVPFAGDPVPPPWPRAEPPLPPLPPKPPPPPPGQSLPEPVVSRSPQVAVSSIPPGVLASRYTALASTPPFKVMSPSETIANALVPTTVMLPAVSDFTRTTKISTGPPLTTAVETTSAPVSSLIVSPLVSMVAAPVSTRLGASAAMSSCAAKPFDGSSLLQRMASKQPRAQSESVALLPSAEQVLSTSASQLVEFGAQKRLGSASTSVAASWACPASAAGISFFLVQPTTRSSPRVASTSGRGRRFKMGGWSGEAQRESTKKWLSQREWRQ